MLGLRTWRTWGVWLAYLADLGGAGLSGLCWTCKAQDLQGILDLGGSADLLGSSALDFLLKLLQGPPRSASHKSVKYLRKFSKPSKFAKCIRSALAP